MFAEYLRNIGNEVIKTTSTPRHPPRSRVNPRGPSDDVDYNTGSGDDRTDDVTTPQPDERRPDPPSPAYDLDILGYFRGRSARRVDCIFPIYICTYGEMGRLKWNQCLLFGCVRVRERRRRRVKRDREEAR